MLVEFPQSSVAVNMTIAEPVAPQSSLNALKLLLQVTPLQTSVTVAPPLEVSQASSSEAFPAPSHSTVIAIASASTVGAVVSSIVKIAVVLVALLQSSVAVNTTVTVPVVPQSSPIEAKSLLQVTPLQASVAAAPPLAVSQASRSAPLPSPSHSTVIAIASAFMIGAVVSCTVTI